MKYTIIDLNGIEEDFTLDNIGELRAWTVDMLNDYYEESAYGTPIRDLFAYIPDNSVVSLIKDFNYDVKEC